MEPLNARPIALVSSARRVLWPVVALTVLMLASTGAAQGLRLSAAPPEDDARNFQVSPDGTWVVYLSLRASGTTLLAARTSGRGSPITLSGAPGPVPNTFQLSPDGRHVVFVISSDLYSVAIDGRGSVVKLSGPPPGVVDFLVSPDGSQVVYKSHQNSTTLHGEIYAVPIDGSAPSRKLNGPVGTGGVWPYLISPDGARVVYRANQVALEELFSVPIDGSQPAVKLNGPLSPGLGVYGFQISPDGKRALFNVSPQIALYSVPIDGSLAPVRLDSVVYPSSDILCYAATPDSTHLVCVAQYSAPNGYELFSVPIDASAPMLRLKDPLSGDIGYALATPDNARVVFTIVAGSMLDLYSVPFDVSAPPVRLAAGARVGARFKSFVFTPDGRTVVYLTDQDAPEIFELDAVPVDGSGPPIELSAPLDAFPKRRVVDFRMAPGGRTLVYRANQEAGYRFEIFQVPTDGSSAPKKLNAELAPGGNVGLVQDPGIRNPIIPGDFFQFAAGGELIYLADQEEDNFYGIFASFLTRPAARASTPTRTITVLH